jgi:hypothetical protein
MNNTDDSASDEEQLASVPMNYSALLAMTRPLVITEDDLLSLRGDEVFLLGFGIPPGPADRRAEFALRRGEIICPEGECDVTAIVPIISHSYQQYALYCLLLSIFFYI